MIFYNHHIEKVLSVMDEADIEVITAQLVLEEVRKMSSSIDAETQRKLGEQRKIFEDELAKKDLENEKEWEKKVDGLKARIKKQSEKLSKRWTSIGSWIIAISVAVLGFVCLPWATKKWPNLKLVVEETRFLISILALFGIKLSFRKMRRGVQTTLFNKIYRKELNELKLE